MELLGEELSPVNKLPGRTAGYCSPYDSGRGRHVVHDVRRGVDPLTERVSYESHHDGDQQARARGVSSD